MRRHLFFGFFLMTLLLLSSLAMANPPCPQAGDRLEDFAYCMRPYPNGKGQMLVGYASGGMDHHTAALMNSMERTVSMPQVYPSIPAAVTLASTMAVAATATYRLPYPYNYWMWGNPYIWSGVHYPIY